MWAVIGWTTLVVICIVIIVIYAVAENSEVRKARLKKGESFWDAYSDEGLIVRNIKAESAEEAAAWCMLQGLDEPTRLFQHQ